MLLLDAVPLLERSRPGMPPCSVPTDPERFLRFPPHRKSRDNEKLYPLSKRLRIQVYLKMDLYILEATPRTFHCKAERFLARESFSGHPVNVVYNTMIRKRSSLIIWRE
jgi:hypothetical protein